MTTHSVIARNNVTRQSIVSRGTRTDSAVRLPEPVDRHGLRPRDDNTVFRVDAEVLGTPRPCHCEEGTK